MKKKWLWVWIVLCTVTLSCSISIDPAPIAKVETPVSDDVATIVAATLQSQPPPQDEQPTESQPTTPVHSTSTEPAESPILVESPTPGMVAVLPQPLYFLADDENNLTQVWRLDIDGTTLAQITHEPEDVIYYDISPVDSMVVYLIENQLYLADPMGENRRLLLDGVPKQETNEYYYQHRLATPHWSPDGKMIAFYKGGLNLMDAVSGEYQLVLDNTFRIMNDNYQMPEELYFVDQWGPSNDIILLSIAWFEGGTFGVYNLSTNELVRFQHPGILCCAATWSADSSSVIVSSHLLGMIESGMWRFDAKTGIETTLLPTTMPDGSINYANWVYILPNGDLQFFFLNSPGIVDGNVELAMVHSASDGVGSRTTIRPEVVAVQEALWAPDGSFALVVLPQGEQNNYPYSGTITLMHTDGSPLRALVDNARMMEWGAE